MMGQHRLIDHDKCTTLLQVVGGKWGYASVESGYIRELSVLSAHFCCEPKTDFGGKKLLKKKLTKNLFYTFIIFSLNCLYDLITHCLGPSHCVAWSLMLFIYMRINPPRWLSNPKCVCTKQQGFKMYGKQWMNKQVQKNMIKLAEEIAKSTNVVGASNTLFSAIDRTVRKSAKILK